MHKNRGFSLLVGYARVSKSEQDTALQLQALKLAGVRLVFSESGSGVSRRPELQNALARLRKGDVLVVWKIDRVARSLADLLSIMARLRDVGASLRSLTEPIDTGSPLGLFTFQILGAVAELERNIIRERSMAGQLVARQRGVKFGRPRVLDPNTELQILKLREQGRTLRDLADRFGVSESVVKRTVYRVHKPGHSSLQ